MKTDTKLRLLEIGAHIILLKGYNSTGIKEILDKAGIPKGSFYFYFKSKEAYGLEILDYYSIQVLSLLEQNLNNIEETIPIRIKTFFNDFLNPFCELDFKGGCPFGNIALEMADLNEAFRTKIKSIFDLMITQIAQKIQEGIEKGEIKEVDDSRAISEFIFFSWEGIIMQMKLNKNKLPLVNFNKQVFETLLN